MEIFPAIDIKDKKAVRLRQGDYSEVTIYSENPVEVAAGFKAAGAKNIHAVDLDGAKDGELVNFGVIEKIVSTQGMFVEVGGGIRDLERIKRYLDAGAGRVILGTAAVRDFGSVERAVSKFGDKIAVGVDAKGGFVAVDGWKTVTDIDSFRFVKKLAEAGVKTVIYTDISKDGLLSGTNLAAYEKLKSIDINIIASGGITYLREIEKLCALGVYGAILGKAIYAGKLDLKTVLDCAENIEKAKTDNI